MHFEDITARVLHESDLENRNKIFAFCFFLSGKPVFKLEKNTRIVLLKRSLHEYAPNKHNISYVNVIRTH